MDAVLDEIEGALRAGLYYAAVTLSLALPDICAALENPDAETNGNRYKTWYRANLAAKYPNITDSDIWQLRCGVVHKARFGHDKMQYSRIIFSIPNKQGNVFHNNILKDALNLDAVLFCRDMLGAVRNWFSTNKSNPTVIKNLEQIVTLRPEGLAPYMVGMPVIA